MFRPDGSFLASMCENVPDRCDKLVAIGDEDSVLACGPHPAGRRFRASTRGVPFELADGVGELVTLYFRNKMDMGGAHRNRTQINADSHRFLDDRIQRDLAGVRIQPNRVAVHGP
ncbi:MAG: hypothetical protein Q9O74_08595 [Planctomycetota bacterium]|nr:hypothetical protein [Planctomycetota bacterium]